MTDVLSSAEDRSCAGASGARLKAWTGPRPAAAPNDPAEGGGDGGEARDSRATDLELMRAAAGDPPDADARETLVDRVLARVRGRARMLSDNEADADDATQASLVEILRSAKNFRGEGSIEAWSERIAVRTTLRLQRRRRRRLSLVDDHTEPDSLEQETPARSLREEIPGEVRSYLEELSEDRRQALILRHVLGHSIDEIAEQTGVSRNTVKDRLRHARRQLRRLIRQRELVASAKGASS